MKYQNLGFFLIIVGLSFVMINKYMSCPKPKVEYRYINKDIVHSQIN